MREKIIVCPNEERFRILQELETKRELHSYRFMTKEEYMKHYFFSCDDSALFYLMKKYSFHIDVAKVILKSLYVIDLEKEYSSSKLQFLKEIIQNQNYIIN